MVLASLAGSAAAQGFEPAGKLGLGVELGEQNGGAIKYWLNRDQALAGGLGIASNGDLGAHAEYVWHGWTLLPQPPKGRLPVHVSLGVRVRDDEFGIRPAAGLDYWIEGYPTELFLDAGPIFRLSPNTGADFTALIGVRFYFATSKGK